MNTDLIEKSGKICELLLNFRAKVCRFIWQPATCYAATCYQLPSIRYCNTIIPPTPSITHEISIITRQLAI